MIDSHAHLYFDRFDGDRQDVIRRAREVGITAVINVGIDVKTSKSAIALSERHRGFYVAAGIHPTTPIDDCEAGVEEIHSLAVEHKGKVVAIGEIGLDYHWKEVTPGEQKAKLTLQLALARELNLPVIFHCREALADLLGCLEGESSLPPGGVFHCFSGTPADARRALELGFHISFAGNVTFPKAEPLRTAAASVAAEKLLLETDSPFLAPQPRRGKRNEPAFLPFIRDVLAEIHGLEAEAFGALAAATTRRLFSLPEEEGR